TLLFSIPLGFIVTFGAMSKYRLVRAPVKFYILIMRGTPLMLQLFAVYFALPEIGINIKRMPACILAFSINYAAYFAEIFRGGILSIEQGQHEAAKVLGFTRAQVFFRIVLPQVTKRVLLPVSNEVITLVKDTALATSIAIIELFRMAKSETSRTSSVTPLFVAALFYLVMNTVVTEFFARMEKRLDYYRV
ncbi:MAG: amino acid ABC transporter permease, partial [Clostridia bacterium]|nr:amino acid ABC transporter permease [Clostridia bacterium]